MGTQLSTGGIHHIRLTVTNVERTQQLYTEILGFQQIMELPTGVVLSNGEVVLGLRAMPTQNQPASHQFDENRVGLDHLSFSVESKTELERAIQLFDEQGIPHGEITDLGSDFGIYILVFRDPDNFQLELSAPHEI